MYIRYDSWKEDYMGYIDTLEGDEAILRHHQKKREQIASTDAPQKDAQMRYDKLKYLDRKIEQITARIEDSGGIAGIADRRDVSDHTKRIRRDHGRSG